MYNLYKVVLKYGYDYQKNFTFLTVERTIAEAEVLAVETFKKYNYGTCRFHSIELMASEGQYADPEVLLLDFIYPPIDDSPDDEDDSPIDDDLPF